MSTPETLEDLYTGELADLWSANDQMARTLKKIVKKLSDKSLIAMFEKSQAGIERHTEMLKQLLVDAGEKPKKEHSKGMEGLAAEAIKHTTEEAPAKGPVFDAVAIAQYQRMTHYGIAGFGTAASFAGTLGMKDAQKQLKSLTKDTYSGDDYMSKLAETIVNIDAKDE